MKLRIISEDKELVNEQTSKVILPGADGEMTILEGHTKLITLLKKGVVRYSSGERSVNGGAATVANDRVTVIL